MKKESTEKVVVKNSFWEFFSKIIEKAGAVAFTIIIARFLLPEGFGTYSLAVSIALIFIASINYSIDLTMMRYVSDAIKSKKENASSYFRYIFKKKVVFSLMAAVLLMILSYPLSIYIYKKTFLFPILFISGAYIFAIALESSYESLFYILKNVKGKAIKEIFKQLVRISLTLLVFLIVAKTYFVMGIIFGLILTSLLVIVFIRLYLRKKGEFILKKGKETKIDKNRVNGFLSYLLAGSFISTFFSYTTIILLGMFVSLKYVGLYSSAIALVWGVIGMLNLSSVFLPVLTQIKKINLETAFNKVMKYSLIITIPAAFGILALSRYIIFFIYGSAYLEASFILMILAFLVIEGVNSGLVSTLFSAREKPKYVTKINTYILFFNIALNILIIKIVLDATGSQLMAGAGAAASTLISRYLLFGLLIFGMKKHLKIKLNSSNFIRPAIASLVMLFSIYLFKNFLIKDMTLISGIFLVIFGALIYILFLFLIKGTSIKETRSLIGLKNRNL